jgi:hypothetical protein
MDGVDFGWGPDEVDGMSAIILRGITTDDEAVISGGKS